MQNNKTVGMDGGGMPSRCREMRVNDNGCGNAGGTSTSKIREKCIWNGSVRCVTMGGCTSEDHHT